MSVKRNVTVPTGSSRIAFTLRRMSKGQGRRSHGEALAVSALASSHHGAASFRAPVPSGRRVRRRDRERRVRAAAHVLVFGSAQRSLRVGGETRGPRAGARLEGPRASRLARGATACPPLDG